jgi:predicted O-methyltransferase YrrM
MARAWIAQRLFPREAPQPGSAKWLALFFAKWLMGVAAVVFILLGGVFRKRHRVVLTDLLTHFGFGPRRLVAELPPIALNDLIPDPAAILLKEPIGRDGNVSLLELFVIAHLVRVSDPEVIFEIGTFDGRTTLNLAANANGRVVTLDLPAAQMDATQLPLDPSDAKYISKQVSGERFRGTPEANRITQVFGDSAVFDFSPWDGQVDFVFIDGAHSKEYVLSDTQRALRMLRPTGGIILWHDYDASFDGVTEALHEIARAGSPVRRIAGTSLAVLTVAEGLL